MIRGAVLPFVRPRGGGRGHGADPLAGRESGAIIVAHDGERELLSRHVTIGRVACIAHGVMPCEACAALPRGSVPHFARKVTADDVAAAVAEIVGELLGAGVEHVAIEAPAGAGAEAEQGRWIARELRSSLARVEVLDVPQGGKATDVRARFAALLGADLAPSPAVPSAQIEPHHEAREQHAAPTAPAVDPSTIPGPRVAGIDPGSHWIAVTIAAGEARPLAYVVSTTIEIGRVVTLAKPRVMTRADGTTREITTRREITDRDVEGAIEQIVDLLLAHRVERVAIERASVFRAAGAAGASINAARAAGLLRANWIGGEIAGAIRATSIGGKALVSSVETMSSAEWRAALKRGPVKAWRDGLAGAYGGSLPNVGEHETDAAGVASWLTRPARRARVAQAPDEPRPKRASANAHAARREAAAARRAAIGCTCKGRRRHAADCPAAAKPTA